MRLLHTADWQLGLKAGQVGDRANDVREHRFLAAERVVETALDRGVDLVLLAGDTFDSVDVDDAVVRRAVGLLHRLAPIPVAVLPGNHDPLVAGSLWQRRSWSGAGGHVRLLEESEELEIRPGVALYPCPLSQKQSREDPTAWIPSRQAGDDRLRVGVAHGALKSLGVASNFPIAADRAELSGLDYLALGDWHGLSLHGRTAYPGTIEQSSFSEKEPGYVLLVDLERGEEPKMEPVRVGRLVWRALQTTLRDGTDLVALEEQLRDLGEPSETLVQLRLTVASEATADLRLAVSELLADLEARLLVLDAEVEEEEGPGSGDLPAGLLLDVDRALLQLIDGDVESGPASRFAERDPAGLRRARRLLHRLVQEESQ